MILGAIEGAFLNKGALESPGSVSTSEAMWARGSGRHSSEEDRLKDCGILKCSSQRRIATKALTSSLFLT